MFTDDSILFYTNKKIKVLSETDNKELHILMSGYKANKLSLNAAKTKHLFFHKQSARDSIPLRLPTITFNSVEIKRESFTKFFGVSVNENITWNKYIELVVKKISKNIGILSRPSHYLDKKSLENIYFFFIHNYVNYCDIAWASTTRTKLNKTLKKQKHGVHIIYNKDKFTHSKPLMRDMNALNVYQIDIF